MQTLTKRKKIFYIPGIVSLIMVPFLFIPLAENLIKEKSFVVIPIVFADTIFLKKFPKVFKRYKQTFPPKRIYTQIIFTGKETYDRVKLDFAQIRIREMLSADIQLTACIFDSMTIRNIGHS